MSLHIYLSLNIAPHLMLRYQYQPPKKAPRSHRSENGQGSNVPHTLRANFVTPSWACKTTSTKRLTTSDILHSLSALVQTNHASCSEKRNSIDFVNFGQLVIRIIVSTFTQIGSTFLRGNFALAKCLTKSVSLGNKFFVADVVLIYLWCRKALV
jgi:hypothetical protein